MYSIISKVWKNISLSRYFSKSISKFASYSNVNKSNGFRLLNIVITTYKKASVGIQKERTPQPTDEISTGGPRITAGIERSAFINNTNASTNIESEADTSIY